MSGLILDHLLRGMAEVGGGAVLPMDSNANPQPISVLMSQLYVDPFMGGMSVLGDSAPILNAEPRTFVAPGLLFSHFRASCRDRGTGRRSGYRQYRKNCRR